MKNNKGVILFGSHILLVPTTQTKILLLIRRLEKGILDSDH